MSPLATVYCVKKTMGSRTLFNDLSLTVSSGEKTAIVGANGSGKSTFLKLIQAVESPDQGTISLKKGLRLAAAEQTPTWLNTGPVQDVVSQKISDLGIESEQAEIQSSIYLSQLGFADLAVDIKNLSGGWKKRAAIAAALGAQPELLILDEPTNHLDWQGILWLESWLQKYDGTLLLVSHDRRFLNNCTTSTVELSGLYPDGYLKFACPYYQYLEKKSEFIEIQLAQEKRMAGKVRRETEWLRAGVKARTTKSRSRMDSAYDLIDQHDEIKQRNRQGHQKSQITVERGEKKSKRAIELSEVDFAYDDVPIFKGLSLKMAIGQSVALLGENGSGKTTLLNLVMGKLVPATGQRFMAEGIQILYFDQARESVPNEKNLMQYLGDDSDYVPYRGQSIHVAAYASRFLFPSEKMQLPIERLSGGEKARLLLAKLLLQPADILILDEPTNDLDIETIEVLENALSDFPGLLIVVSHDRQFLENLCDRFVAIQEGKAIEYGDLNQWLTRGSEKRERVKEKKNSQGREKRKSNDKKLKKKIQDIERQIDKLETSIEEQKGQMTDPTLASDHEKLTELSALVEQQELEVEQLMRQWEELSSET